MVVNSLMATLAGGALPTTVKSAIAGLSPLALLAVGWPPLAIRYSVASAPAAPAPESAKRPSSSLRPCASCFGAPALAAHNVTAEPAIGDPAPVTRPLIVS